MNFVRRTAVFTVIIILVFLYFYNIHWNTSEYYQPYDSLIKSLSQLEKQVARDNKELYEISHKLDTVFRNKFDGAFLLPSSESLFSVWKEPIPTLVFVCNRVDAVKYHINRLIKVRGSSVNLFPIIVSQDCENEQVVDTIRTFGSQIQYVKHKQFNITVPKAHKQYLMYYKIAHHYKLGLQYIFETLNYSSVIITEDDLDVSEDFFLYFAGTRPLLDADPTLFCVSAWNDNGKAEFINVSASELLYRTDFFPGLGWMMTKNLWLELADRWPLGFWDDWIREPEQRRERACIRPEVSRTAMTEFGKVGASKGLFFNKHLRKVLLNQRFVNFTASNLSYLLKKRYDAQFSARVFNALRVQSVNALFTILLAPRRDSALVIRKKGFRIEYKSMEEYTEIAQRLRIMPDTKAGVPRTAYLGVVTCFVIGVRVYIAPVSADFANSFAFWQGYDRHWEASADLLKI